MIRPFSLLLSFLILMTAGCTAKVSPRWDRVMTEKPDIALSVPFYPQSPYYCGPSSLAMMLKNSGVDTTPDETASKVFTPSKKGSFQEDMVSGARRNGRIPLMVQSPDELSEQLKQGRPTLVFLNLGLSWHPVWHYAVVTGIKPSNGYVIMNSGDEKDMHMNTATFDHVWARTQYWGYTLLKPGEIPDGIDPIKFIETISAYELTDPDGAALSYKAAYEKWQKNSLVMMAYANSYYDRDKPAEAADIYRRITELYPDYADAWNNLALALHRTGITTGAVWAAEKAVKIGGKRTSEYADTLKFVQTP